MWTIYKAETGYMRELALENALASYAKMPDWLRSRSMARHTGDFDSFSERFKQSVLFVGSEARSHRRDVIVAGDPIAHDTYEGHLFCDRDSLPGLVKATIEYGVENMFEHGTKRILCVVRSKHRGLKRIVAQAGFDYTGYTVWDAAAADGKTFEGKLFMRYRG